MRVRARKSGLVREARILGLRAPSSHLWPWQSGSVGRVLMGHGPSCSACPHPTPLWPQGPGRPARAQSQTESCWGSTEVVSGPELPTSANPNREDSEGRSGVTPTHSDSVLHIPGARKQQLLEEEPGASEASRLAALHRGIERVSLQTAQAGWGLTRGPPLSLRFQGEVCAVQKMCGSWGPKSLSLLLR